MSHADAQFRVAAKMMAERLKVWKKMQIQARERGEDMVELHVSELFEVADASALQMFEDAMNEIHGARPLPFSEAV